MKLWNAIRTVNQFVKKIGEDDVPAYSGQSALFIIISFFPFLMFLLTLIQFLPISETALLSLFDTAFPDMIDNLIRSVVSEIYSKSSGTIISITVITALWSASRGLLAIIRGLNSVYRIHETRHYVRLRIIAVIYTLIFAVVLMLTLALLVFGNTIYAWCVKRFPEMMNFIFMIINGRTLITLTLLILFFWVLFTLVPNRKTRFLYELPGAIITACGWMLFSFAYSFYIEHLSNFSYMYGSLTAIVLLMLWLYFCMYIMFVGAEVNSVLHQYFPWLFQRKKRTLKQASCQDKPDRTNEPPHTGQGDLKAASTEDEVRHGSKK